MPALTEKTNDRHIAAGHVASDGTKPWRYYAKPFDRKGKTPMIAIIVTGLGQSKLVTEAAIKLPENVALLLALCQANRKLGNGGAGIGP